MIEILFLFICIVIRVVLKLDTIIILMLLVAKAIDVCRALCSSMRRPTLGARCVKRRQHYKLGLQLALDL